MSVFNVWAGAAAYGGFPLDSLSKDGVGNVHEWVREYQAILQVVFKGA